jgi:PAS domain S-box-containing protein
MYELYGIRKEDFSGAYEAWLAGVHPNDRARCDEAIQQALRNEKSYNIEFRVLWPDGTTHYIKADGHVVWDEQGNPLRMTGINYDITERKLKDLELQQSGYLLSSLIENLPLKLFLKDAKDLKVVLINKAGVELLGITREQIIGRDDYDLFPREQADAFHFQDRQALRNMTMIDIPEEPVKTADKGIRILHTRKVVITDVEHQPKYLLGISEDITERTRAEKELIKSKEEAERANRAKSDFLSRMSHELRTPLHSILGFSQVLEDNSPRLAQEEKQMLQQIRDSGGHLLELIDEVLDITRIEAGKLELFLEDVELAGILTECHHLVRAMADKKNIAIHLKEDEGLALHTDRTRLKQILLNLLSNAIKYNQYGGSITVNSVVQPNDRVRVTVTDTGKGIPEDQQGRVFQPFARIHRKDSATAGTGMGLTISQRLVEEMGGKMGFESRPGAGSSFWFELPASDRLKKDAPLRAAAVTNNVVAPGITPATGKVLYVEDTPANVQLMRLIVKRLPGVELLDAHTAERGIVLAKEAHPDLILMDIDLPGMDGIEALKLLRQDAETRHIPVIAVSAAAMPHDIERIQQAGFDNSISKPFNIQEVPALLAKYLTASKGT